MPYTSGSYFFFFGAVARRVLRAVYIWLILFFFAQLSGAFEQFCEGVSLGRHRRRMLAGAAS
jgi:hypothetical protein